MKHTFKSDFELFAQLPTASLEEIQEEPMFWQADYEFAMRNGSTLTRRVLEQLPDTQGWIIDTRAHMLMPGHLPAIGGWHCDWVPRTIMFSDGPQPDLNRLDEPQYNYIATMSTHPEGVSLTHFLKEDITLDIDPTQKVWTQVENQLQILKPRVKPVPDNTLVRFARSSLHTASPAKFPGWRWFIRASKLDTKPQNKYRRQSMVYIISGITGW